MEISPSQKSLERVVSQKALQLGSSISCQSYVLGFLCGVCLTSLCLAALASFGTFELGGISFSANSMGLAAPSNSTSQIIDMVTRTESYWRLNESERRKSKEELYDEKVSLLYSAWSALLDESVDRKDDFFQSIGLSQSKVPRAPHLESCELNAKMNERLDRRAENGSSPPWTSWKGFLDMYPGAVTNDQLKHYRMQAIFEALTLPGGSDEENFPLTRRVQHDIWIHQHPSNCRDPSIKFLMADWERLPGFGVGAQFAGMCGLLAIAIKENRVLVTNYYNRADHDGCKGTSRASWSCYFFLETSQECRDRAFELMDSKEAWEKGTITAKEKYTSKEIWAGRTPRKWGEPWSYMQPTTDINGTLITYHRKMDRRWWRAQALRYLMRFQSEYTCNLMNAARHAAFGREAAKLVLASVDANWPEDDVKKSKSDIEEFVWSNHKPWIPRPLLSMHVRMGDKACEMKVVEFEEYMLLAERIRKRFPHLHNIWLSTEMQKVIDKSKSFTNWKFYYTNVTRQMGNITMATYEASLGRKTSTNYPLVNFLMASEADFFIGALGSTWCFLIDGMRNTGGKVMAGYLSVNKDRFW